MGSCDLWTTSDQFFQMNAGCMTCHYPAIVSCNILLVGDYEEHAILLCNYMLSTGIEAWVVLGRAIPEVCLRCRHLRASHLWQGSTAYVLSRIDNQLHLWNAVKGESFSVGDFFCPLQCVRDLKKHVHNRNHIMNRCTLYSTPPMCGPMCNRTSRLIR